MRAAAAAGARPAGIWTRRPELEGRPTAEELGHERLELEALGEPGADLLIIAVRDDAIAELVESLARQVEGLRASGTIVLHLSGSRGLDVLAPLEQLGVRVAALHPLVSFPDHTDRGGLEDASFALEGGDSELRDLRDFSRLIGAASFELGAAGKTDHHLAAAFASNLVMILLAAVDELGRSAGVGPDGLRAYRELARRALDAHDRKGLEGLTGPWVRGDLGTLRLHLDALADRPGLDRIYRAFAAYLLEKKGSIPDPTGFRAELDR